MGKHIHETSYEREKREIELESIKLDWLDLKSGILHEVKKNDSCEEAHEWQVLYYLYYLKQKGVGECNSEIAAECNSGIAAECNSEIAAECNSGIATECNSDLVIECNSEIEGERNSSTIALRNSSSIALNSSSSIALKGEIDYPKLRKKVEVILTREKEVKLKEILKEIEKLISMNDPPPICTKKNICKKCSYFELCLV